jgi:hypothetical protein
MNKRERVLAIGLLTLVLLLGGAFVFHLFFYEPMDQLKNRIAAAQKDIATKERERDQLDKDKEKTLHTDPRLKEWRKLSLPEGTGRKPEEVAKHLDKLQRDYESWLYKLLEHNGFSANSITVTAKAPDSKSSPTLPGKGPLFTRFAFIVKGQASLDAVVRMLSEFHKTNLLHQVRGLTLVKPETTRQGSRPGDLDVDLTVEALMVAGADKREKLLPDDSTAPVPQVLAVGPRRYEDLRGHNIFQGVGAGNRLTEDRAEVLSNVKLTTLTNGGRRWEGFLYDKGKGPPEIRLRASIGFDEFTITDRYGTVLMKAKVVRLDDREVIFQSGEEYYRLGVGDDLQTAMKNPLKKEEVKSMGLVSAGTGDGKTPD